MDNLIRKILGAVFHAFHMKPKDSTVENLVQFLKFGIVGVSNTFISYVLNVLVLLLLAQYQVSWDFIAGNLVAFVLSVLWSFYWNNEYVFRLGSGEKRNLGKALLKTYISYGFTGIILSNVLSWLWITVFGISKYVAPILNLIISVPLNYIINKYWAFKKTEDESAMTRIRDDPRDPDA